MTDWRDDFGARVLDRPTVDLSGVSDDPVCHLFNGAAPAAACGVPRSEQPDHGGAGVPTYIARRYTHCPGCGNPICGRCQGAM